MTRQPSNTPAQARRADRPGALKSLASSLIINALCPFLLYRLLEPHFAADSLRPLLYATIFPVIGLLLGFILQRTVDVIAILAMAGLMLHVVVTLLARSVGVALVIRSLDGTLIGLALIVSALIDRPFILYVARQFVAGADSDQAAILRRLIENDCAHTFFTITLVWGICLIAMSGLHVVLALKLAPANFLLVSPIVGVVTIAALLVWTGRYLSGRGQLLRRPIESDSIEHKVGRV
jgi:hypothetical protein